MATSRVMGTSALDWAFAGRPMTGESVSGDLHLVRPFDHCVLLAVVDGVGHGDAAMVAARAAVEILSGHAAEPVVSLIERCHEGLKQTRGVVMTVSLLNTMDNSLTWLGVGNVEGRLLRAGSGASYQRESLLLRGGLVGYHLPFLRASSVPVARGDLLAFATDGVGTEFEREINLIESPQQIADNILNRHFKGNDDALALVARYLGA